MVRLLLSCVVLLALAATAVAACGPRARATPVRSAVGALRQHHIERVESRGAGCRGAAAVYGCTGYTPAPAPMPMPPKVPLKK